MTRAGGVGKRSSIYSGWGAGGRGRSAPPEELSRVGERARSAERAKNPAPAVGQVGAAVVRWPDAQSIFGNYGSPFGDDAARSLAQAGAMKAQCPAQRRGVGAQSGSAGRR